MKHFAFHVEKRAYSDPGPCQSTRGLRKIRIRDYVIYGCLIHRSMLGRGRPITLTKSNRADTMAR